MLSVLPRPPATRSPTENAADIIQEPAKGSVHDEPALHLTACADAQPFSCVSTWRAGVRCAARLGGLRLGRSALGTPSGARLALAALVDVYVFLFCGFTPQIFRRIQMVKKARASILRYFSNII